MGERQLAVADHDVASSTARLFPTEASSAAIGSEFEQALTGEIAASEQTRMRVVATVLAALLISNQLLFLVARDMIQSFAAKPLPPMLPLRVIGPFLGYEILALLMLHYRLVRGRGVPTPVRFVNAVIETSLPTVILWWVSDYGSPAIAFGTWPSMLYFIFIIASTLRLNFVLPVFTGVVAAAGYMVLAFAVLPDAAIGAGSVLAPRYHLIKACIMLVSGLVAGAVALRLRAKFRHAVEEAASRERITNLFGQHVSPAVVDRLLGSPAEFVGEIREICVMFLDIRNFTANARERRPEAVVAYLNAAFAFMIEAVDRHGGFINKFLGDGFMAVFGAPLHDPDAARHAVAAARDILAEIDRRSVSDDGWPLEIGVGLHLGPAVIGNVGSPRRKEFTAIGDTVNLAARLEQLTKERGSRLIVSDAVVAALGDAAGAPRPLGSAEIKGYTAAMRIWALDGQKR